jgi:hypothetical protein
LLGRCWKLRCNSSLRDLAKQPLGFFFFQRTGLSLIAQNTTEPINTPDSLPNYVIPIDTSDRWWEDLVGLPEE